MGGAAAAAPTGPRSGFGGGSQPDGQGAAGGSTGGCFKCA